MTFVVDDPHGGGGDCFMCFKDIANSDEESSGGVHPAEGTFTLAFKLLTRYLKVDLGGVVLLGGCATGGASPAVDPLGGGEVDKVSVRLCIGCGALASKFSELYQQLDLIRLQADDVVRNMHGVMVAAEAAEEYSQKRVRNESEETEETTVSGHHQRKHLASLSGKLREKVVQKCSRWARARMPRVDLRPATVDMKSCLPPESLHSNHQTGGGALKANSQDAVFFPGASSSLTELEVHHAQQRNDDFPNNNHDDDDGDAGMAATNNEVDPETNLLTALPPPPTPAAPPPPPPPINAPPKNGGIIISFKNVGNGRYQCSVCSKTVQRGSKSSHVSSHLGVKSFNCNLCCDSKSFQNPVNLREHEYSAHRSSFFAKHKDPKLTSDQFEAVIGRLFESIEVPKVRDRLFKCSFCDCGPKFSKSRVQSHWIKYHMMDVLVPRLRDLQGNRRRGPAPPPPRPASEVKITGGGIKPGKKAFKCNHCGENNNASFARQELLLDHEMSKHRHLFFAQHKEPSLTLEEFEAVVVNLFEGIDIPKIRNGEYKCSFCPYDSIMSNEGSVRNHFIQHHMEELVPRLMELQKIEVSKPLLRCELCAKPFQNAKSLWNHKYWKHPSLLFAQHKDARLTSAQLDRILATLFDSVKASSNGNGSFFKCSFCDSSSSSGGGDPMIPKGRAQNHFIRHHMDELVPRLRDLQKMMLEGLGGSPANASSSSRSPSLSSALAVAVEDAVVDPPPASDDESPNLVITSVRSSSTASTQDDGADYDVKVEPRTERVDDEDMEIDEQEEEEESSSFARNGADNMILGI